MKGREVVALTLVAVLLAAGHLGPVVCQSALTSTFYASSCPSADQIVRDSVGAAMNASQIVGPSVLRLFAHDCFVGGCDGSILLQDTSPTSHVERDNSDNLSLQQLAFDAITQAKVAVEAQCPGVVSCADILVMASEDVVSLMGGPSWTVLLGRRDGVNSSQTAVTGHLPGSSMDVSQLMGVFGSLGLSKQDLVVLSGAHTVGFAHCGEFVNRLYNFNNVSNASDPSLTPAYLTTLKTLCPKGNISTSSVQALDPTSAGTFDNAYYRELQTGRGLLFSDQVMFVDNSTTNFVTTYANNQAKFFTDFVASMLAMSQVGVLTGTHGEIRLNCSVVNSGSSVHGNSSVPPSTSTAPPTPPNSTPPPAPVTPTPPPVVKPSPPPGPVVKPPPPHAPVTPSPPPAPVVTPSPPVVTHPPPHVTPSPPPPKVTPSPPPVPVKPASPPPPKVTPSPPPVPVKPASPPPPKVTRSPHPHPGGGR